MDLPDTLDHVAHKERKYGLSNARVICFTVCVCCTREQRA